MTSLAVAMWFGMFAVQTDKSEVGDAAKKIAESKSYSWKGSLKFEGQLPFGGGGGGGGGADIPEQTFSGSFEDGVGSHILTDASEFISVGDKSVTRPRGEWRMVEAPGGGGGGGGGGNPFGRGGMGRMMGMFSGTPKSPHDELKEIDTKLSSAKKSALAEKVGEIDCTVYECELTEDAARENAPMGRFLDRIPDTQVSGTLKVWVDGEGRPAKFQLTVKVSASFQGNDFEVSTVRTVSISKFGETKVTIPEDAKAVLEGKKGKGD